MRRTYVSSQGVTFVEKPDWAIKIDNVHNFTVHRWAIVADTSRIDFEPYVRYLIRKLKFKVVRFLYGSEFDTQLKQKGLRCGLKIVKQTPRRAT